jgi:Cys-tRNA synthase (O-phospho-L-seryl-tRNA:Cys-tRNA synthase)
MSLPEAVKMQFRLVDAIHRYFTGREILQAGDYGADPEYGRPRFTAKVETALADFFEAEDAILVRGAGTGAIRAALMATLNPLDRVVVHDAPVYATTAVTFRAMGLRLVRVNLNQYERLTDALSQDVRCVYVQHSRQLLEDRYDLGEVIRVCRAGAPGVLIVVDDNYTVMQVPMIGCQLGADLSTFSTFKVLGPTGVGCVVGRAKCIQQIRDDAYSGGSKVQGPEAMDMLKTIVFAPVVLAIQAEVVAEIVDRLNRREVEGVIRALASNHQERTALVELEEPIAHQVIEAATRLGAAPYPVGSSSRYEVSTMIYRLSRTMIEADPSMGDRFLRVNPFRSGPDTVMRILLMSVAEARKRARSAPTRG